MTWPDPGVIGVIRLHQSSLERDMPHQNHRPRRAATGLSSGASAPLLLAYLIIMDGYDEHSARDSQSAAIQAGLKPHLVAQTVRPVIGSEGTLTRVDLTVERVRDLPLPRALLVIRSPGAAAAFAADPRLSRLVDAALKAGAVVGVCQGNLDWQAWLTGDGGQSAAALITQGSRPMAAFLAEVFNRVRARVDVPAQTPDTGTQPLTRVP